MAKYSVELQEFGRRVRQLRERLRYDQRQLSKAAGYANHTSIVKIEQGRLDIQFSKMLALAKALGVPVYQLLEDFTPLFSSPHCLSLLRLQEIIYRPSTLNRQERLHIRRCPSCRKALHFCEQGASHPPSVFLLGDPASGRESTQLLAAHVERCEHCQGVAAALKNSPSSPQVFVWGGPKDSPSSRIDWESATTPAFDNEASPSRFFGQYPSEDGLVTVTLRATDNGELVLHVDTQNPVLRDTLWHVSLLEEGWQGQEVFLVLYPGFDGQRWGAEVSLGGLSQIAEQAAQGFYLQAYPRSVESLSDAHKAALLRSVKTITENRKALTAWQSFLETHLTPPPPEPVSELLRTVKIAVEECVRTAGPFASTKESDTPTPSLLIERWKHVHEALEGLEKDAPPSRKRYWDHLTGREQVLWKFCRTVVASADTSMMSALWARREYGSARSFICEEYGESLWQALWSLVACAHAAALATRRDVEGVMTWGQQAIACLGGRAHSASIASAASLPNQGDPVRLIMAVYEGLGSQDERVSVVLDQTLALLGKQRTVRRSLRVNALGSRHNEGFVATLLLELVEEGRRAWYPDPVEMAFVPIGMTFRQALDTAWQYVGTQVELPPHYDVRWCLERRHLPMLDGGSIGLAAAVGLQSLLEERACLPSIGLTGEIDNEGHVHGVQYVPEKVVAATREGLSSVIIPVENAREARVATPVLTVSEALAIASGPASLLLQDITLKDRQVVRDGDLPLQIEGHYVASGERHVWVVLQDDYGKFYLQHPEVTFFPDGRWIARNIVPGMGIEFVHFVTVGEQGQAHCQRMVINNAWGAFDMLPADSTLLHSVRIIRSHDVSKAALNKDAAEMTSHLPQVSLEVETLRDGQTIREDEIPLRIEGSYTAQEPGHVWVVLQDRYGQLYLQNPEILFLPEGRWVVSNVRPGIGIEFVHFVAVGELGQIHFRQMVSRHEWGAFMALPADSMLVRTIRLTRV